MTAHTFSNVDGVLAAMRRAAAHLVPPPDMLPSVWAEQNIRIPVGNAIPGPISFANAPYQRGMVDVIKEPGVRRVDYMTGAQLGKTTVQQCITGYFIAHEPRSQIFAQPSQGDMQTFLETKLQPMLDANKSISSKMAKVRGREGVNNSRIKSYIGGWLMFSWAGSPKTARGRSAPVVQADEVDGMPPTAEGDFVELLAQRAATFGDQQLMTRSSTPTIKGVSRIEAGFLAGDQRRFYVPCPDCGEAQHLKWSRISWNGRRSTGWDDADKDAEADAVHEPNTAVYTCEHCGSCWDDGQRIAAIRGAEAAGSGWKASKPFTGHASFHAPEWLSTFRRLRDIVQSYLDKLRIGDLQSFKNVSAAETWEEQGEQANPDSLMARAEEFAAPVPAGGLVLTAGVDMQQDRLEVEVVAWGEGEESWSVHHEVLWGDPDAPDVWEELEELLSSTWLHEHGAQMPITATCVDTGGTNGNTQSAYDWLRGKTGRRIFAVKGGGSWGSPIVAAPNRKQSGKAKRKVDLFIVGANEAKLTVMRRLAVAKPGPGFCHFPKDRDPEWFQQLTAEKLVTRYVKGFPVREWHKTRPRNEALDCRQYALAALKIANPSMRRAAQRLGDAVRPSEPAVALTGGDAPSPESTKPAPVPVPPQNPQEEAQPVAAQGGRVVKTRRVLRSPKVKGGGWATRY
jgi:phage terminase large subunit GpA-like protein